ncbi:MAG: aldehyde dehydrogenase family protein [Candidatus Micrarchaeota archaeon]|nr:aldehyde dehydrogenase family protein [Candidatus Micrarchaeota archaeon]
MPGFVNEYTYRNYMESGKEGEFDKAFDDAVDMVGRELFGKEHPLHIGDNNVMTQEKLIEYSPIDGTLLGNFQKAGRNEARQAIDAAADAFASWSAMDYRDRAAIFQKAADLFSRSKFELAAILSMENGKTRYESIGEVDEAIDFMRYYATEVMSSRNFARKAVIRASAAKVAEGFQGAPGREEKVSILMKPYGVFGIIGPFNFPLSISVGMSTGALITGNTVVFKPSTDNMTMLTGMRIYELFREAGIPAGVFNYVSGPGSEVGDEIVISPKVEGIAFTGSRKTGLAMMKRTIDAGLQKTYIVEMSGKNPVIVSKISDIDAAAEGVAAASFGYSGQKCSSCSRVYVHESVKDQFVGKLLERTRTLRIGNPLMKESYIGPIISKAALDRYTAAVKEAGSSGKIIFGGKVVDTGLKGIYVEPVVALLDHGNRLFHDELFLPFVVIDTYKEFDEALSKANDSEFGLTAGLYSNKSREIRDFLDGIRSGVVYVNRETSATTGAIVGMHSFVGWKGSGLTGKGTGSRLYLHQFMHEQSQSIVR